MAWQPVFASSELPEGGMKLFPHGKREIGVFRHRGKLYAVLNFCPHAGAPVCKGEIDHPVRTDTPGGSSVRDFDHPTLRCPWHHWEFDLATGKAVCPISSRIKTYGVREDDVETYAVRETEGRVWLDI